MSLCTTHESTCRRPSTPHFCEVGLALLRAFRGKRQVCYRRAPEGREGVRWCAHRTGVGVATCLWGQNAPVAAN